MGLLDQADRYEREKAAADAAAAQAKEAIRDRDELLSRRAVEYAEEFIKLAPQFRMRPRSFSVRFQGKDDNSRGGILRFEGWVIWWGERNTDDRKTPEVLLSQRREFFRVLRLDDMSYEASGWVKGPPLPLGFRQFEGGEPGEPALEGKLLSFWLGARIAEARRD